MTGRRTCILEISETVTPRQKCRRLALWLCSEPTGVTGLAEEVRESHAHLAKPKADHCQTESFFSADNLSRVVSSQLWANGTVAKGNPETLSERN